MEGKGEMPAQLGVSQNSDLLLAAHPLAVPTPWDLYKAQWFCRSLCTAAIAGVFQVMWRSKAWNGELLDMV